MSLTAISLFESVAEKIFHELDALYMSKNLGLKRFWAQ